ncbi:carbohydrate ABC transporter permease [Paenibacillus segetis]|uniref:Sugar ABC transporter permease n=1 Tax=Paenibacillus segetis TaxID=1325360 RepID=A0ABQ1YQR4_9BACL|nr:carbohydrate ABC transporter permease [Paenibacillus segetis]GGH35162.1 sugar ABC transporter permease [Paenibacillus segetis]
MAQENRSWQWFANIIYIILTVACLAPFVLLLASSLTDETEILKNGYSFFPKVFSTAAYEYLFSGGGSGIFRAYGITIFVTVFGTAAGLFITALLAYPMSRSDYPASKPLAFVVFFTLLFNGGLVPTYLVYTQLFDVKNTVWGLIVPGLLMNGFNVMLMQTFFRTSIPMAIIESASIDGAGEFRIFRSIILRLSTPVLATVGLFQTLVYWNDWMNGTIYINDTKLYGIQNMLNRILSDAQYLASGSFASHASALANTAPLETVKMAIAVIGVVPIMVTYPFFQKYFVKGIALGAVKG